jgi:hypothetical protein
LIEKEGDPNLNIEKNIEKLQPPQPEESKICELLQRAP